MKQSRLTLLALVGVVVVGAAVGAGLLLASGPRNSTSTTVLPTVCAKPPGGFLIVASGRGYNDSVDHGVSIGSFPKISWPIMNVHQNQTVNITICNTDVQAHGFQISHYFENTIEVIAPGQSINVSFVADQTGAFRIYCEIPCSIHWAMQSGELLVS